MNEESQSLSTSPSEKLPTSEKHQSLLLKETTTEERGILRQELSKALAYFLSRQQGVYLEGFGILIPVKERKEHTFPADLSFAIQKIESLSVCFEKCLELTGYHRDKFPGLVENGELASRIYPRLPFLFQLKHSERILGRFLKALILSIRNEVIVDGVSLQLEDLGSLYSLHNRQGQTIHDWFAGSDVFLVAKFKEVLKAEQPRVLELPLLESAWEILDAAYGERVSQSEIQITKELFRLGYSQSDLDLPKDLEYPTFSVAAYRMPTESKEVTRLLFCTDGLRHSGINGQTNTTSSEITVQAELPGEINLKQDLPNWPIDVICLGWLLLQSSKTKSLQPQMVLSTDTVIGSPKANPMRSILTVPLKGISLPQRTSDGFFYYINVTGITDDEAKLAEMRSPSHLSDLLVARNYDQVTRPDRRSLLSLTKDKINDKNSYKLKLRLEDQDVNLNTAH